MKEAMRGTNGLQEEKKPTRNLIKERAILARAHEIFGRQPFADLTPADLSFLNGIENGSNVFQYQKSGDSYHILKVLGVNGYEMARVIIVQSEDPAKKDRKILEVLGLGESGIMSVGVDFNQDPSSRIFYSEMSKNTPINQISREKQEKIAKTLGIKI